MLVNISLPILQALLVVPCRAVGWCRYNRCGLFTVQTLGPLGQSASRNSTRFVWESQLGLSASVHKTNRTNSSKYSKLDSRTLNGPQQWYIAMRQLPLQRRWIIPKLSLLYYSTLLCRYTTPYYTLQHHLVITLITKYYFISDNLGLSESLGYRL